ncbi:MAG: glycosyltransferase [Candidatus Saccharimonadales bacterium]
MATKPTVAAADKMGFVRGRTLAADRHVSQKPRLSKEALLGARSVHTAKGMRVAIVHDWLIGGGAELVVEELHKLFPNAPIFTSYCTPEWRERLDNKVVTGWLQHLGKIRKFIPFLRVWWFTHINLKEYDLVISSSGAEAKGIKVSRDTLHVNYCHAPTHYYWSRYDEYMEHPGFGMFDWLARLGLKTLVWPLRRWDYKAAQRPDYMIANSNHTAKEIKKYYGRDAVVIFPPVNVARFQKKKPAGHVRHGFVISGRQTPYKRFDLAVKACTRFNFPLTVIGDGPDNMRLRRLAGKTVNFVGRVSDEVIEEEFANAKALIFPGTDDFGITAVEALAAGTPVVAYEAGGALDYVVPGKTGEFFSEPTAASLADALHRSNLRSFNHEGIATKAMAFAPKVFDEELEKFLKVILSDRGPG